MNRSCPLFECDRVTAADLDGFTMLLGNSANMERAGRVLIEWFVGVGVAVEPDNQPCSNYLDLYLSGTGETFGIALGECARVCGRAPTSRYSRSTILRCPAISM